MNTHAIEALGHRLAHTALTTLLRICPQIRHAPVSQQDAACAAMRAEVPHVVEQLILDARGAPRVAGAAYALAALSLAQAGAQALQQASKAASDFRAASD